MKNGRLDYRKIRGLPKEKSNCAIRKSVVNNVGACSRFHHIPLLIFMYTPPLLTFTVLLPKVRTQGSFYKLGSLVRMIYVLLSSTEKRGEFGSMQGQLPGLKFLYGIRLKLPFLDFTWDLPFAVSPFPVSSEIISLLLIIQTGDFTPGSHFGEVNLRQDPKPSGHMDVNGLKKEVGTTPILKKLCIIKLTLSSYSQEAETFHSWTIT